jgi:WD40 repeat protein
MSRNTGTLKSWVISIWLIVGILSACSHYPSVSNTETPQTLYLALTQAAATLKVAVTSTVPTVEVEKVAIPSDGEMIEPDNAKSLSPSTVLQQTNADSIASLPGGDEVVLLGEGGLSTVNISPSSTVFGVIDNFTVPMVLTHPSLLNVAKDNDVIAWVNNGKSVDALNFSGPGSAQSLAKYDVPITGLAISPDGENISISAYDSVLRTWKYNVQEAPREWTAPSWLIDLSYSPDKKFVGGVDPGNFRVYIFDAESGDLKRTLEWINSASPVLYGAYFSPDWKFIAWISRGTAQIMETDSEEYGSLLNHEDFISAVAWSPNSRILAIGTAATVNGNLTPVVVLWDALSGDQLSTLTQSAPIESLAFSSDGKVLAVLESNGDLQTWSIIK